MRVLSVTEGFERLMKVILKGRVGTSKRGDSAVVVTFGFPERGMGGLELGAEFSIGGFKVRD